MIQKISAPVSVQLVYDHRLHTVSPRQIFWDGQVIRISKVGMHHTIREGRTLFHIFSIASNNLFFRLKLDTDTLFWTLEEIADGLAN
ncbi:MAG TPA: hypothetical protein PLI45_01570 [Candidatus Woesebacteria bacterium]|nr:hypothetical protein [Candidatus Woesebacteria bacterium]